MLVETLELARWTCMQYVYIPFYLYTYQLASAFHNQAMVNHMLITFGVVIDVAYITAYIC